MNTKFIGLYIPKSNICSFEITRRSSGDDNYSYIVCDINLYDNTTNRYMKQYTGINSKFVYETDDNIIITDTVMRSNEGSRIQFCEENSLRYEIKKITEPEIIAKICIQEIQNIWLNHQ